MLNDTKIRNAKPSIGVQFLGGNIAGRMTTDFGIESLIELIKMYKDDPTLLKRCNPQQ